MIGIQIGGQRLRLPEGGLPLGARGEFGECHAAFAATGTGGHAREDPPVGRACRRCASSRPGTRFSRGVGTAADLRYEVMSGHALLPM